MANLDFIKDSFKAFPKSFVGPSIYHGIKGGVCHSKPVTGDKQYFDIGKGLRGRGEGGKTKLKQIQR